MTNINEMLAKINKSTNTLKHTEANSFGAKAQMYWDSTVKFWSQVAQGCYWLYKNVVRPVTKEFFKPVSWLWKQYQRLWFNCVYSKKKYGVKKFVAWRAAALIATTVICLIYVPHLAIDMTTYAATAHHHVSYLNNSQEVITQHNVHAVRGCDETPVCSEQEAIYYRADPDLFNQIWSLVNHGGLFYPDYVAAAVPPTTHRCELYTYGWRWKWLIRNWDIYPEILEVKCFPLENGR